MRKTDQATKDLGHPTEHTHSADVLPRVFRAPDRVTAKGVAVDAYSA